jgi:hypothetical protein
VSLSASSITAKTTTQFVRATVGDGADVWRAAQLTPSRLHRGVCELSQPITSRVGVASPAAFDAVVAEESRKARETGARLFVLVCGAVDPVTGASCK